MKGFLCSKLAALLVVASIVLSIGYGQNPTNLAYQVANVMEDVRLLDERLRLMNAELESMRRENNELRQQLASSQSQVDASMNKFATLANVNAVVADAVKQLEARDDLMRDEIVLEVTRRISDFAKTVNKTIGQLPPAPSKPNPNIVTKFHDNYPKQGVYYKVKSGDSLSKIAKAHNSQVEWIQHANERPDPSYLLVGEELWIPVPE